MEKGVTIKAGEKFIFETDGTKAFANANNFVTTKYF